MKKTIAVGVDDVLALATYDVCEDCNKVWRAGLDKAARRARSVIFNIMQLRVSSQTEERCMLGEYFSGES